MSYAAASDVAAYTPNLIDGASNFSASTIPALATVSRFLSSACSLIEAELKAGGYSVPVPSDSSVYDRVVDLEALYAAGRAEMVRMTSRVAATERTRGQFFNSLFKDGLKELLATDLSRAGLTHTSKLYAGGISKDDKASVRDDGDRVKPRFGRDQFRIAGAQRPSGSELDEESE